MKNKIDTKKIKSKLSLSGYEKIMKDLGIPMYSKGKNYWIFYSGDHHKDFLKHSPKLYFYTDTKIFISYTASRSYDIFSLVQARLALIGQSSSFIDAINFILSSAGLSTNEVCRISQKKNICDWQSGLEKFIRFRSTGSSLKPYDKAILTQFETRLPQEWVDEGISIDSMLKYHIGFYERIQATTIPCFGDTGELLGIRGRFWSDEQIAMGKYRPIQLLDGTIYSFPTNATFYGINYNKTHIQQSGHVILVEGEKSVLKADSWWGEKSNVLALYGSNLGLQRRNQLIKLGVDHVTIAIDSDFHEIGDEGYNKFEQKALAMAKLFKGYAKVDVVYNNIGLDAYKSSPFDFDETTYNLMWENREVVE